MKYFRQAVRLFIELLRELADERAYERHLAHHQRRHSPAEWRRFQHCRLSARYVRPKCC